MKTLVKWFWIIVASLIGIAFVIAAPLLAAIGTMLTVILGVWFLVNLAFAEED